MEISSEKISVVVQGPVDCDMTWRCLASIRNALPNAQIILSTWEDAVVQGLENFYDDLVLSHDPGMIDSSVRNLNRQLVSTKAGLALVKRRFILKIRSDMLLVSSTFLRYYGRYEKETYCGQKHRMLITNYYTRNPRIFPLVYHPSDWLLFGTSEDVKNYYDIPLAESCGGGYTPEQYIFTRYLMKNGEDVNDSPLIKCHLEDIVSTERVFAECFVVLDYKKLFDVRFLKYHPNIHFDSFSLVRFRDWYLYYRKYCRNDKSVLLRIKYILYSAVSDLLGYMIKLRRKMLGRGK